MNSQSEISAKTFNNQAIRILYAEGNGQDAELTRSHFAKVAPEFEFLVVDTAAACLEQIQLNRPELLLLNYSLPDTDSEDMLNTLHSLVPGMPLVVLTGLGSEKRLVRDERFDAANYVPKQGNYLESLPGLLRDALPNHADGNQCVHQLELELQNRELHRAKAEIDAVRARYVVLYDSVPVGFCTVNREGLIEQANLAASGLLGVSQDELLKQPLHRFIFKEDWVIYNLLCNQIFGAAISKACDLRMVKDDGTPFSVLLTAIAQDGDAPVLHIVLTDVTELKQAEKKLHLAASVFSHAREGIMITAVDGAIIEVNDAFCDITGYSRDEVLGRNPRLLSSGRQPTKFYTDMWRDVIDQGHWYGEVWNRRKNGDVFAVMQTISAVRDEGGTAGHYVSLFFDITALKEYEKKLEFSAYSDALTGLPNRLLLANRLQHSMAQTRRRGRLMAVAFFDLDGFKAINDNHGHEAGDQLLIAVANCMKQTLREGDTLARLGGDEFVAVLPDLDDSEASMPMLSRLLAAASEPIQLGEYTLQISASIGVAFYPQEAEDIDADQLLRQADQAMYQAKQAGKNRYHLFDARWDRNICGRYESLEQIRQALAADEFVLYYQPKVNMRTGEVVGAEALIRWQHPEKGLLRPMLFLPEIEDHSLAIDIGEWVINTALTQMEIWQAAGLNIRVSVNVGARQLQHRDFVERLRMMLVAHPNVSPSSLKLEVMETSALNNVTAVSRIMESCRAIGVLFSMDDFGTGYSSLTYLKQLPVSTIKIDQTFVHGMLDNMDDLSILRAVICLSAAFHREVIAEGVESIEHGAMLLRLGCDLGQGYSIAHPMPAHKFPGWVATWRPDPSWV